MKIAFTSQGQDGHAPVDPRFGRADYFLLYDQEKDCWTCLSNTQNLEAAHGAGIQAGQTLLKAGADILITGHVGPKAFKVLEAGKVKMYSFGDFTGAVKDALTAFRAGKLTLITAPDSPGRKK